MIQSSVPRLSFLRIPGLGWMLLLVAVLIPGGYGMSQAGSEEADDLFTRMERLLTEEPDDIWDRFLEVQREAELSDDLASNPEATHRFLRMMGARTPGLKGRDTRSLVVSGIGQLAKRFGAFDTGLEIMETLMRPEVEPEEVIRLAAEYQRARILRTGGTGAAAALAAHDAMSPRLEPRQSDGGFNARQREHVATIAKMERLRCLLDLGLVREASRLERTLDRSGALPESAWIELLKGRPERAREVMEKLMAARGSKADRAFDLAILGEAHAALGNKEIAQELFQRALTSEDSRPILRVHLLLEAASLRLDSGERQTARALLDEASKAGPDSLQVIRHLLLYESASTNLGEPEERVRARLARVRDGFRSWLARWRQSPVTERGLEFLESSRRANVLFEVADLEAGAGLGPASALGLMMEAQACGTTARRLQLVPPELEELGAKLREAKAGVVSFLPGRREVLVFAMDGNGTVVARVSMAEVGSAEAILMALPQDRTPAAAAEYRSVADRLSALLIPVEIAKRVRAWESVRVNGLDLVTSLPPDLLRMDGAWLGCTKPVALWPSIVVGHHLEFERRRSDGKTAILIHSAGNKAGVKLPFSALQLASLRDAVGPEAVIAMDDQALLRSVPHEDISFLYVHCHGGLDPRLPRPTVLALAQDVDARALEAYWLDSASPDTVLLGACRAGRKRVRLGEDGADGLVSALVGCGTRAVLAARGELFHIPTQEFALAFAAARSEGLSDGESAHTARNQMKSAGRDPRDFGMISLIGALD